MSYGFYKVCTVKAAQITGTVTDLVACLPTAADNDLRSTGNGGNVRSITGQDIRCFADANLTIPLHTDLVYYDPVTGVTEQYVLIPSALVGSKVHRAYGNPSVVSGAADTATWPSRYQAVWPFPDGTTLSGNDRTANAYNLGFNNTPTAAAGQIDGGMNLAAVSGQDATNSSIVPFHSDYTVKAWVKVTGLGDQEIVSQALNGINQFFLMEIDGPSGVIRHRYHPDFDYNSSGHLTANTWARVAVTFDHSLGSANGKTFINGAQDGSGNGSTIDGSTPNELRIGSLFVFLSTPIRYLNGGVDQVEILNTAESPALLEADYNNQFSQAAFWDVGPQIIVPSGVGARFIRSNGGIWVFNTGGAAGGGLIGGSGGGF